MKYIDKDIVESVVNNARGQFMSMTVDKKDGTPRKFVFKVCPNNAPTFENHSHLKSIRESGGRWRSFDVNRVLELKACKTQYLAEAI